MVSHPFRPTGISRDACGLGIRALPEIRSPQCGDVVSATVTGDGTLLEEIEMNDLARVSAGTGAKGRWRAAAAVSTLLLTATLVGCGGGGEERLPVHPVQGQILLQGKPLANALVAFHPKSATGAAKFSARGQTDEQGTFRVTTYDTNDGAPAGEYAVTVQYYELLNKGGSFEPGPNVLAYKLSKPDTTDITVKVAEGANELKPIEVTRQQ